MLYVKAMVSLFKGFVSDYLSLLRYSYLRKKVVAAKTFVAPEKLLPTESATKHHSRRTYLQVMEWMGMSENLDPTKLGWTIQGERHICQ